MILLFGQFCQQRKHRSASYPGQFALSELLDEAWNRVQQVTSHPKSPRTTGNEAEHIVGIVPGLKC